MKKTLKKLIYGIVGAVTGILLALIFAWPRVEPSDLYKKYESRSDLNVDFFKDYKVDDSTSVDVTILTAKDSAAWVSLMADFGVKEYFVQSYFCSLKDGTRIVMELLCDSNDPKKSIIADTVSYYDFVIYTSDEMSLFIFHRVSNDEADIIASKKTRETFHR